MQEQHIGQYIKQKREQAGLSLSELARRSGVSKGYLSEVENGSSDLSLSVISNLARVFGLGAGDFLVEAGYTNVAKEPTTVEVLVNGVKRLEIKA